MLPLRLLTAIGTVMLMVCLAHQSHATTWANTTVDDPFADATCDVSEPASFGSYVYDWPSKYDAIYWPYTESRWIWVCPTSGYVSFGDDFSELTEEEKSRIKPALAQMNAEGGVGTIHDTLVRLERLYEIRDKDQAFWAWLYRVLAYWHNEDAEKALAYRQKALTLIEQLIDDTPAGFKRITYLYLMGDYNRQLGNDDLARQYFAEARAVKWTDEDGNELVGAPYYDEIIDERLKLMEEHEQPSP